MRKNEESKKEEASREVLEINRRLKRIVRSFNKFTTCFSLSEFGSLLLESVAKNMLAEGGSLYIIEKDSLVLTHSLDPGHAPPVIPLPLQENSAFGKALKTGKPQIYKNIRKIKDISTSGYDGYGNETALIFPITEDGKKIKGLLSLHTKNPPPFTWQDLQIGKIFMAQSCETMKSITAAKALKETEESFRSIFSSLNAGIIIINEKTGIVTNINNSASLILGLPQEKAIGRSYQDACKKLWTKSNTNNCLEESEVSIKKPGGGKVDIIKSLSRFTAGSTRYIAITFFDITDIVNTRNELESKYAFYQSIINTSHIVILLLDSKGTIVFANPYIETLTGRPHKSYEGELWVKTVIPEKEQSEAEKHFEDSISGLSSSFTSRMITEKNSSDLSVMWFNSVVKNRRGDSKSLLMLGQDITPQIRIEERLRQAEKMEAIGQLSSGIAHDFNNQLAGILGYSEILKEELSGNTVLQGYLEKIISSVKNASELTTQLLAYSRKGKYEISSVNMHKVIDDVSDSLSRTAGGNIIIEKNLYALKHYTQGDETQLYNAVFNLAINSLDAMQGHGKIVFTTDNIILGSETITEKKMHCEAGLYLHILVADNGEGMDSDTAAHIFEPFFTTRKTGKNPGLGLSSVYGTVNNHNGFIEFKSTPGEGSLFEIYLPASAKR